MARALVRCATLAVAVAGVCLPPVMAQAPAAAPGGTAARAPWTGTGAYRETVQRLVEAAQADDFAWRRVAELTDTFGPRLSGSDNLAGAIEWAVARMKADGLENVRTEPVQVPHWERGTESAEVVAPARAPLPVMGLGGTVPTPPGGLEGDLVIVGSFEELRTRGAEARGRIVLFNVPFVSYPDTVVYRTDGARVAAQLGAIAVLVRGVAPMGLRTLHTGSVEYAPGTPSIPAASITAEDANRLARLSASGQRVRVRLVLENRTLPDAPSANVIGEVRGRERPDEIVLIGGHLDSWDVGPGASDDAVGCVVTWEALRLMRKLGVRPRRTVRVVLWTNEENGVRGGNAYAAAHAAEARSHVFALEADSGVFWPATLAFTGSGASRQVMRDIVGLLAPLGFGDIVAGGGGADIGPIATAGNTPTMAYIGDPGAFFPVHHTAADTVERIPPADVSRAAAAIAAIAYVIAEMPNPLPR